MERKKESSKLSSLQADYLFKKSADVNLIYCLKINSTGDCVNF